MCLLHLLKFSTSWGALNSVGPEWLEVVGSWEEQAGLAAFLGRRELLALHIPVCWSEGPRQGRALGSALWSDQSL